MKSTFKFSTIIVAFALILGSVASTQAQCDKGPAKKAGCDKALGFLQNVTPEQQTKLDAIHLEMDKQLVDKQAKLGELQAHLKSQQIAAKPDKKAINASIDEISTLRADIQKVKSEKHQEMRALLTEEQRVAFDKKMLAPGCGEQKGEARGEHKGEGPCKKKCD